MLFCSYLYWKSLRDISSFLPQLSIYFSFTFYLLCSCRYMITIYYSFTIAICFITKILCTMIYNIMLSKSNACTMYIMSLTISANRSDSSDGTEYSSTHSNTMFTCVLYMLWIYWWMVSFAYSMQFNSYFFQFNAH